MKNRISKEADNLYLLLVVAGLLATLVYGWAVLGGG